MLRTRIKPAEMIPDALRASIKLRTSRRRAVVVASNRRRTAGNRHTSRRLRHRTTVGTAKIKKDSFAVQHGDG